MADGQTRGTTRETPICQQCTGFPQPHGFQITGGIQHLLHAGPTTRSFVTDKNHITFVYLTVQDGANRRFLAFNNSGRSAEVENAFIHPSGFNDAAFQSDVTEQHRQAAVLAIGILNVTDTTIRTVVIQGFKSAVLTECHLRGHTTRPGPIKRFYGFVFSLHHVVLL